MSDTTDHAAQQVKEAIWTYGGWFVLLSLTLGAGITLGYIFWGDAIQLRVTNTELRQKIANATSEAENSHHKMVAAQEEEMRCKRKLAGETGPTGPG